MNTVKSEPIILFCLTPDGVVLTKRLAAMLPVICFTSEKLLEERSIPFENGFANTACETFMNYPVLIFIGVTGIAAHVLALLANDKFCDPAMVVIDERAQRVISLLSGHAGSTNALVRYLASMLGADPVIITAADVNDMAVLGTLAFQLNARMGDFCSAVKIVDQMLVGNKRVGLWWDDELTQDVSHCDWRGSITVTDLNQLPEPDALVCTILRINLPDLPAPHWKLVPQRVIAGIGYRRDVPLPLLAALLIRRLGAQQLDPLALEVIGSISLKKDEQGFIQLAPCCRALFKTLTVDVLHEHEYRFPASPFARKTVGTGSISSPAVWLLSHGKLLGETPREQGVTTALGVPYRR